MSLILAIEPDAAQADAVRRAVRTLAGVDLVLVESRAAALAVLKGRVPDLILLSALLPPGDEAALAAQLRTAPTAGHVEMITIPLLEHAPDRGKGLFGGLRRRRGHDTRVSQQHYAGELKLHLERIAEAQETSALARRRKAERVPDPPVETSGRSDEREDVAPAIGDAPASAFESSEPEWTGPRDTLGERDTSFDDEGRPTELLRLPPEFTDARASIADRIVRLADVNRSSFATTFRLEEDARSGRLVLVSERVPGIRLAHAVDRASQQSIVPDLPAALFVMRRLLSIAAAVRARTGVSHLAIAPERIVITPRAEIVVVEAALAAAFEGRMGFEPGARADIAQIALTGLSLMLGRPLPHDDGAADRQHLLGELGDVATIRVSEDFASSLRAWFERSLANDMSTSFADFTEAAAALEATSTRADGGGALRRVLKTFVDELADPGLQDESEIEAARVRATRARQIASRHASAMLLEATEREPEFDIALPQTAGTVEAGEPDEIPLQRFDEAIAFAPLEQTTEQREAPIDESEPAIEAPVAPPPPPPQEETRKRTLLELFRSARAGEQDPDAAPSIFRRDVPEPVVAPPPVEPEPAPIFAQSIEEATPDEMVEPAADAEPHSIATEPVEDLPVTEFDEPAEPVTELEPITLAAESTDQAAADEIVLEPEPAASLTFDAPPDEVGAIPSEPEAAERFHAETVALEPVDEPAEIEPPVVEAPPAVPPAERRKPSLLELFRSTRPRDREPEQTTVLGLEPTSPEPVAPEPAAEPLRSEIISAPIEAAPETPAEPPQVVAERADAAPPPAAKPEQPKRPESAPARKSLLRLLRSSPFRKSKPEPEPPPPPPAAQTPPEKSAPLTDVFAELIQAARAVAAVTPVPPVAPAPPPARAEKPAAPIEEKEAPPVADKPAPPLKEKAAKPTKKIDPPPPLVVVRPEPEPEWTPPPAPSEAVVQPPEPTPVSTDWPTWNVEEFRQSQFSPEERQETPPAKSWTDTFESEPEPTAAPESIAASEAVEPVDTPDDHAWPTWTASEPETPEAPPAPPKKRRKHTLRDIFRSSRSPEATDPPDDHEPQADHEPPADRQPIDYPPPAEPADPIYAPRAEAADPIVAEFEAAEFGEVAEPAEIPAYVDVPPPVPPAPSAPTYVPPTYAPTRPAPPPTYVTPPATYVPPAPPAPPPSYAAAPAPTYVAPAPTYVAPPPPLYVEPAPAYQPPAPRPYAPPPPAYEPPSPTQPIRLAPAIPVEAPIRLAPMPSTTRTADVDADRPFVPATFRGPVTRKTAAAEPPRRWAKVAAAAVAVACVAIAGRAYYLSAPERTTIVEDPAKKPIIANPKGMGTLSITSDPPGARVTIDGKPRGVTPLTLNNLRAGSHRVVLDGSDGTVKRDVKIVAGRETKLDESIYSGWIAVYAPFELRIFEGTRLLGTTEEQPMLLAPGRHQLELTNSDLGYHETRGVEVIPGETTTINIKAAEGIVHINAPDGAEVWVDGKRMGQTPVGDLRVPLGSREIVVKHPELGEQRAMVNVTAGAPVEVPIEFRRPR